MIVKDKKQEDVYIYVTVGKNYTISLLEFKTTYPENLMGFGMVEGSAIKLHRFYELGLDKFLDQSKLRWE